MNVDKYYQAQHIANEAIHNKNIVVQTQQNSSDNDTDDAITNKSEYRKTVYGERLRKKLQDEMDNEKMRKEELKKKQEDDSMKQKEIVNKKTEEESKKNEVETKIKSECFDKVNNKENLALINEAAEAFDINASSEKTLETVSNCTDFIKTEETLTKKNNYSESKDEQYISKKNDIPQINKHFVANDSLSNIVSKNYSNNSNSYKKYHNDSSIHKDYRNRDDYNHHDRHRYNEGLYTNSSNRHSRKDKYYNLFEQNVRHRSSHRYKSRDRESSSSSTKDDIRKKYSKSVEEKHDHVFKKLHKKDKEYKLKQDKFYKRDKNDKNNLHDLEISKKYKECNKINTQNRKRRCESEEKMLHENKRKKLNIKNSMDKISMVKERKNNLNTNENLKDEGKKFKIDNTIEGSSLEEADKKPIIKKYNDKITNSIECVQNSVKLSQSATIETKINNCIQKLSTQSQDTNQDNDYEKVTSKNSHITDITVINKKDENQVECLLNEIEEGEIIDSPKDESRTNDNGSTIQKNLERTASKELKIEKTDKSKETLNSFKVQNNDLFETANKNCRSLEIIRSKEEHCTKSKEPKKDENKNMENRLLFTLLTQDIQTQKLTHPHYNYKDSQENTVDRRKLQDIKSMKYENNLEKTIEGTVINVKSIKNDKTYSDISVLHTKSLKIEEDSSLDDDHKLQVIDNDEIIKEENIQSYLNENNVENIFNVEKNKDSKELKVKNDEDKNICIEKNQIINDNKELQKSCNEEININNYLNKEVFKPLINSEMPSTNNEVENSFNKKTLNASKSQAVKNVIIVRRRRRPVQLSDSPPVLVITQNGENKST
jgi:hypothetical protein